MKNKILRIVEIVLSALTFPLWFVKMFIGIGHLPNQTGEIVEVVFCHSMYENICAGAHPFFAYVAMFFSIFAIVLNVLSLGFEKRTLRLIANIVFAVTIGLFVFLLLYASALGRGY